MQENVFPLFILLTCYLHYSESSSSVCGHRTFGFLAPCQDTCQSKKSPLCLSHPGCYCEGGLVYDENVDKCVLTEDCSSGGGDAGGTSYDFSNQGGGSFGFHFGTGVGANGKAGGKGEIGGGGGSGGSAGGKGGSSLSISGSLDLKTLLGKIIKSPLTIPSMIMQLAGQAVSSAITLNMKAATLPLTAVEKGTSIITYMTTSTIGGIMGFAEKFGSFNAEAVAEIIDKTEALSGWLIRTIATTQIFGMQTGFDVAHWAGKTFKTVIDSGIDFQMWGLSMAGDVFDGTVDALHIQQIFSTITQLPGLKQGMELGRKTYKKTMSMISDNCQQSGDFVASIIMDHEDFFIPIFTRTLNVFLTFTNAIYELSNSGKLTGFDKTIGKMHLHLGSLYKYWNIVGLGEQEEDQSCENSSNEDMSVEDGFTSSETKSTDSTSTYTTESLSSGEEGSSESRILSERNSFEGFTDVNLLDSGESPKSEKSGEGTNYSSSQSGTISSENSSRGQGGSSDFDLSGGGHFGGGRPFGGRFSGRDESLESTSLAEGSASSESSSGNSSSDNENVSGNSGEESSSSTILDNSSPGRYGGSSGGYLGSSSSHFNLSGSVHFGAGGPFGGRFSDRGASSENTSPAESSASAESSSRDGSSENESGSGNSGEGSSSSTKSSVGYGGSSKSSLSSDDEGQSDSDNDSSAGNGLSGISLDISLVLPESNCTEESSDNRSDDDNGGDSTGTDVPERSSTPSSGSSGNDSEKNNSADDKLSGRVSAGVVSGESS